MPDFYLSAPAFGKLKAKVSPVVLLTILDHFIRRDEKQTRVIGTLLGSFDINGDVEVKSCYPVPHTEANDQVSVDTDFHQSMLDLHLKVNPREFVVGWYSTGDSLSSLTVLIHQYYAKEMQKQNREVPPHPVHLMVDPTLASGGLAVKAFCSSQVGLSQDQGMMLFEAPCEIHQTPAEKIGMNLITKATMSESPEVSSDLESLEGSILKLSEMLTRVTEYVDSVLEGKTPADPVLGRFLMDLVSSVPQIDKQQFETSFNNSIHDLLMVVYLANMTKAQLAIAEKINQVV